MEIKRIKVEGNGGCNCCKTATLKENGHGLKYPYDEVNELLLGSYLVRLCDDCTRELSKKLHLTANISNANIILTHV